MAIDTENFSVLCHNQYCFSHAIPQKLLMNTELVNICQADFVYIISNIQYILSITAI